MLKLKDITKTYVVEKQHFPALKGINLVFPDKGFVSILGPSGCGKTTLLNLIGGLDQYTSGDLIINNKSTKKFTDQDWDAYRNKRVGFVFQTYNLVPHLTVLGNVELSMTLTGMSKKERQKKATAALARVGLKDTLKKKPNQLSGGQMQRVAIARSLVNNPEIILADEPTGALDSVTSVQVMEILKEVAKDRLVVMVTHNNELAEKYSTRIIRLKDGRVISDTKPLKVVEKKETKELEQEKNKHTHMSFFTALGSSAKSLLTKKGRTVMTAVAASFGIIGVALVLAMSNGFQGYVNRVESETASSVPITVSPFVTTQIKQIDLPEAWQDIEYIRPYDEDLSQLMVVHRNRLTKEYAYYAKGLLQDPNHFASSVLENHEYLDFNIFTERANTTGDKEIIKVNQFEAAGAGGSILSGVTNLPSTIFHELYGGKEYINSLYDVVGGTYPNDKLVDTDGDGVVDYGELCVVCDRYNRIPMSTLYALGLSSTSTTSEEQTIGFKDIIGHEYKAYKPSEVKDAISDNSNGDPFVEKEVAQSECAEYRPNIILEPEPQPQFIPATESHKIKQLRNIGAGDAKEVRKYLYDDKTHGYKPIRLKITGIIRPKRETLINLMPGSVCYAESLKKYYIGLTDEYKELSDIARNNYYIDINCANDIDFNIKFIIAYNYAIQAQNTTYLYEDFLNNTNYFHFYNIYTSEFNATKVDEPSELSPGYSYNYLRSNYRFASEFAGAEKLKLYEVPFEYEGKKYNVIIPLGTNYELSDLLTYSTGYSTITSVLIFPRSLSDKNRIFNYLDKFNEGKLEDAKIMYSDLAGNLTSALGTMIDVISIVLIVFSSVSLLVSCVMTGVITYTSVLERTKEIGILRAIGARKKDVGRLFEAESVIIGGVAGLAGVIFTFIVEWPISAIINARFPDQQIGMICNLSPWHALILVIISILLTFVSGFIPARKAAKKDPVVALRTE